jgi:hypothetical protein
MNYCKMLVLLRFLARSFKAVSRRFCLVEETKDVAAE